MDAVLRSWGLVIPLLLLVISYSGICGRYTPPNASSSHSVREATTNTTARDGGGNEAQERGVFWLSRHWYVLVVALVMIIVVFVLVCGCVLQRGRLTPNLPLQTYQNGNRYTPQIDPLPHSTGRSVQQPAHAPPAHISTEPIESTNRYTETSLATPALSSSTSRTGPSLSAASRMNQPPSSSESPWSFIQSVGKGGVRQGEMSEGVREGRGRWGLRGSKWRSHRHYSHHHHSPAYWQRARHHRHITNPLAKVNCVPDERSASLCSLPSTSGCSMHSSDHSNHSSSHSHSENSTLVEVNVNVRLSPDRMDGAKAVAMAALAESAKQLAESAANLGFCEEVHMCTKSLPHSPCPPPRHSHRRPRHTVSGAPLTPHPPSPFNRSQHLFQSLSSSHLPLPSPSLRHTGHPTHSRQSSGLERPGVHNHYSPLLPLAAVTTAVGCTTEDEGTVVSLDRNSSSSSCLCPSVVSHQQRQRSNLTHSPLEDVVVSLDRYSSGGVQENDADMAVVSLDHSDRSKTGDLHNRPRSVNQILHRPSVTDVFESQCCSESGRDPPLTCLSCGVEHTSGNCWPHQPLHSSFASHTTHRLNLDSQIEGVRSLKHTPRLTQRDTHHQLNGLSLQAYPHLSSSTPSPKLSLQQELQNISEQGESECVHSSDNFEQDSLEQSSDQGHEECAVSGRQRKLAEPDLLLGLEKLEGEGVGDVRKGEGRGKRRRKRDRSQHRGIGGAARDEKLLRCEEATDTERDGGGRDSDSEVRSVEAGITHPSHREDPLNSVSEQSKKDSVLSLRHNKSSSPSVSLSSQKAPSPPQSGSALSVCEPLGSTASGYAATGESESTCDMDPHSESSSSSGGELGAELEEIQQALLDARTQFSYPLQRLLDQNQVQLEPNGCGDSVDLSYSVPRLVSSSNITQSQSDPNSTHFQTHPAKLNAFGMQQQIQSVDV